MFSSERLHRDPQFHSGIPVCAYKLVVLKFDNIPLIVRDGLRHLHQLARFIRQKHGDREDPVALDQAVLDDG